MSNFHYIRFLRFLDFTISRFKSMIPFYLLISRTYVSSRISENTHVNVKRRRHIHIVRYIHSTWLVLCNPITPSQSAFVYLSTWFSKHRPWIILTPSRVHLAVWHHLSTFIDIHFLHLVENNGYKHTPPGTLAALLSSCSIFQQSAWQTLENIFLISTSLECAMETCLTRNKHRRLYCDRLQKARVLVASHQIHSWHLNNWIHHG